MRDIVLVALLLGLVGSLGIHTLTSINQDVGRHLILGEKIWKEWSVPKTNLLSYTAPDFSFINHHWLGEVFIYLVTGIAGLTGLIIFKAVILTTAFALAFFAFWRRELTVILVCLGVISAFIIAERTDVRPEILSFLFLGWFLFVLFRRPDSKLLYSLPLVEILWANTHIYFFMGPVLFTLYLFGEWVKKGLRSTDYGLQRDRRVWIGVAIVVATLANPNSLTGALYPLHIFDNYGYSIVENKNPFFLSAYGYPWTTTWALFTGIFTGAIGFLANWRRIKENIFSLGIFLISAGLALAMVRNYPLFGFILMPVAVKNLWESGWRWRNLKVEIAIAVVLASLIVSVVSDQIYVQAGVGQRFGLRIPTGGQKGVDFVRATGLKGPMFNNFDIGSFLIWKLPEEKVFIDGRPEAYPDDFIQNIYIKMQEDADIWEKYTQEYGINFVFWNHQDITPWSQIFVKRILKDPKWPLIYSDNSTLIFIKNTQQNRDIISKYRIK